jgi:hypothetical protein
MPPPAPARGVLDARRFCFLQTFSAEAQLPCLRHRRPAPLRWATPAQQNPHNSSSISVSVKPSLRKLPRVAEAAREPKPSAWPDVDKTSKGHFPQQFRPYGLQSAEISKVGSSEIFLRGSELWNIVVTVLDLGVFIPLGPPTATLSFPLHRTLFQLISLT